jgi:hypothetical protein
MVGGRYLRNGRYRPKADIHWDLRVPKMFITKTRYLNLAPPYIDMGILS